MLTFDSREISDQRDHQVQWSSDGSGVHEGEWGERRGGVLQGRAGRGLSVWVGLEGHLMELVTGAEVSGPVRPLGSRLLETLVPCWWLT